jgi:hypothetical protein
VPFPFTGWFRKRGERVLQRRHTPAADATGPVTLDVIDKASGGGDELAAAIGRDHERCSPVSGVGSPFEISQPLEIIHQVAHGLVRHTRPRSQPPNPRTSGLKMLENRAVRGTQVVEALGSIASEELVHELLKACAQQDAHVSASLARLDPIA